MKKAIGVTFIGNVAPPLSALLVAPMLARALGVDGRGEVAAATAPLLLCVAALTLGLPESLLYFAARVRQRGGLRVSAPLALLILLGALGTLGVALISPKLAAGDPVLASIMTLTSIGIVPGLLVTGIRGVALGQQRWWLVSSERVLSAVFRVGAISYLFLTDNLTPTSATLVLSLAMWVGGIVYVFMIGRSSRNYENLTASTPVPLRDLLSYGLRVWLGAIAGILLMRVDQVLLTPLSGVYALGLYAVAVNVSEIILVFNTAVREVVFSQSAGSQNANQVAEAARLSTAVTTVAGLVTAAVAPILVPLFFGTEFSAAVIPSLILLGAVIIGNPGSVSGAGLSAFGLPQLRSYSILFGLVVNLLMLIFLAPDLGAIGAALATAGGNLASGGMSVLQFSRRTSTPLRSLLILHRSDLQRFRSLLKPQAQGM